LGFVEVRGLFCEKQHEVHKDLIVSVGAILCTKMFT